MKALIAGGSGFIGKELSSFLSQNKIEINWLSRHPFHKKPYRTISWAELDSSIECDFVINLCGENILSRYWTQARKQELIDSRVKTTKRIAKWIQEHENPPKIWLNASAVGAYPGGNLILNEESDMGNNFLSQLAKEWEEALFSPDLPSTRRIAMRIGVVLGQNGGVVGACKLPFKLGLGGKFSSGTQAMPWISIHDLCKAVLYIVKHDNIEGVVNFTSPCQSTNADFTKAFGEAYHRPTFLNIPAYVLRALLGARSQILLNGSFIQPNKLLQNGFKFEDTDLKQTISKLLKPYCK